MEAAAGRVTLVNAMVRPAQVNSRANLLGVKLKDAKAFEKTLDTLIAKAGPQMSRETFAGVTSFPCPGDNAAPTGGWNSPASPAPSARSGGGHCG